MSHHRARRGVPELYIGLMSGTSLDGVDGVIAECADAHTRVIQHAYRPFPPDLAAELLQLNSPGGVNELHRAALAGPRTEVALDTLGLTERLIEAAMSMAGYWLRCASSRERTIWPSRIARAVSTTGSS